MSSAEATRRADVPGGGGEPSRPLHVPVMPTEVLQHMVGGGPRPLAGWVVDATTGMGGHAALLLEACPQLNALCLDQDEDALGKAGRSLERFGGRVRLRRARMSELARTLRKERIGRPLGILLDLGVSSMQLDSAARGFSFHEDGPLDMRMDRRRERTAADVVNTWDEGDLADLFYYEGDETRSRQIARAICEARRRVPFRRTLALADVVARAAGGEGGRTHPATRTFQALRRAVNEEGEELLSALAAAEHWLADEGRLVVLSFHSGEDREVKRFVQSGVRAGRWSALHKKPLSPGAEERRANRRARSARLRAAVRVRGGGLAS